MSRGKKYLTEKNQDDYSTVEKIRRTKRSVRGRTKDDWIIDELPKTMMLGRVLEVHKRHVFVAEEDQEGLCDTGKIWFCSIVKRHLQRSHQERNFVVVGDRVAFETDRHTKFDESRETLDNDLPKGVIQHALKRENKISRKDPLNPDWEHVLFANIDLIMIVASVLKPIVRYGLIDRLLVRAELDNIPAIIVFNKVDLIKKPRSSDKTKPMTQREKAFVLNYEKHCKIYKDLDYNVFEISALHKRRTASEIKRLRETLKGKLIGFIGHSGVGKSSIINLMKPEIEQIVDEDSDIFHKGRHTTTYNSLLQLDIGAYAIDSPGIRAFDVESYDPQTLSSCFREFRPYTCKYRSCTHTKESECEIKAAVEREEITLERYKSYLSMVKGTK